MGLQTREVVDIFRKQMVRHMAGDVKLMIAWVECSPESIQLAKTNIRMWRTAVSNIFYSKQC